MSSRGSCGRGSRGHCRRRGGARAELSFMGCMPNLETNKTISTLTIKTGSQTSIIRDDALSQVMFLVLKTAAETRFESVGQGLTTERLWFNGVKLFRGITRVAHTVAEYWLEFTEHIMDDIDCTSTQKIWSAISLLRDKAC